MSSRILVIGDVMLDRYVFGDVGRLSQEAPVPIVTRTREECRAGAAANVAMNCASLGSEHVTLIGIAGMDQSAASLLDCLRDSGVFVRLLNDISGKTTEKLRIIGRNQQIVRVDTEEQTAVRLGQETWDAIQSHDILVLSDYGKGALWDIQTIINVARAHGKTVLVDPKGYSYARYGGAHLVKPNINEMRDMMGGWTDEAELERKANQLRESARISAILVTRAADGMTLFDGKATHIHASAKEVFDVTGAGDTVMAAMAVMLSRGESLSSAAHVANIAAGIAVSRFGTYAVTKDELKEAMHASTD